jgi:hypothetical protein
MHVADNIVKERICLYVLQLFVFPQINSIGQEEEKGQFLFQKDSTPPHFNQNV